MSYQIIYADPAWKFNDKNQNGNRGASCKYDVMSLEQMKDLPVADMAADDCTLFMWHVPAMPLEALELVKAWGFTLKTMKAFTWVKLNKRFFNNLQREFRVNQIDLQTMPEEQLLQLLMAATKIGLGHWSRGNTEDCLIAVRGKPKRQGKGVRQLIIEPIREHSRKPDCTRDRIVELIGDLPRVELFARQNHPGWHAWGNEVEHSIPLLTAGNKAA
ncbi:MT-A70 family methyltransferase [Shewanella sp. Iso12]|uniref:MT-A70 family methyltransferase n=1 Tax=Shewanella sp. Iso12 TaxID=1826753 RepID=UPI0014310DD1|nr:MT-A70 family methyltransferase [Shewanella sp. Iso12]NJI82876.1 adenine methylase [Shewanella sp. Iso12]